MLFKRINIDNYVNPGLKLWSINKNYIIEAQKLFDEGYYKFIELFVLPGSYDNYIKLWKDLNIPIIIHAPHYREGMNLADKTKKENNTKLANEAKKFADDLNSGIIIFHPGVAGETHETARQLREINEPRAVIENKPYLGLDDDLICNGYSPEEIKYIMSYSGVGFCLDIGHAICAANALKVDFREYLKEFFILNPVMFHLTDGDLNAVYDSHLHLGDGNYNLNYLVNLFPLNSIITLETVKNSKENLNDFVKDIEYLRQKIFIIKLATENDIKDVFDLSNDPIVRNNSFNSEIILFENHVKWFNNKLKDRNTVFYIIRNINQEFVSQIRLEKENENNWIISISIVEKFRGKGLVKIILKETINKFLANSHAENIYAFIKKSNTTSLISFQKAGFSIIGEETINNNDSFKLKYV